MSKKKTVSDEDMALFREAVGEVRSVVNDRVDKVAKPLPIKVRSAEADDRSVMQALLEDLSEADLLETGEHLAFTRDGIQRSVLRKLKSGRYAVQSEIDLHGLSVAEARVELAAFLHGAGERRHTCVRVIHGKGRRNADNGPRLKPAVNQWLQRHRLVVAFCSARAVDGGTGAVYVLLRKQPL